MTSTNSHARRARLAAVGLATVLAIGAPAAVVSATNDEHNTSVNATALVDLDDPAVYATLTPRQQTAVDELVDEYGVEVVRGVEAPPTVDLAPDHVGAPSVFTWFGKEILSWGIDRGRDGGFGALGEALGFGDNGHVLDSVNEGLTEINERLDKVDKDLQAIADKVVYGKYADAQMDTNVFANRVQTQARRAANFEISGITPQDGTLHDIFDTTQDALGDLGATLLEKGVGTIPAFVSLDTHTNPVSDTVAQWDRVLDHVEGYRALYAQGLMTMLWAAQFDSSYHGDFQVDLETAAESAKEDIVKFYDYLGAPYPQQPGADPWIHANGHAWGMSNAHRAPYLDEWTANLTHKGSTHVLNTIANGYRPNGQTLRQTIDELGINSTTRWADHHSWDRKAAGCFIGFARHYAFSPRTTIEGNGLRHSDDEYLKSVCTHLSRDSFQHHMDNEQHHIQNNPTLSWNGLPLNDTTGMPALMDGESIRAIRDGVADLSIERGNGDAVDLTFSTGDYTGLRILDIATGDVLGAYDLATFDGNVGQLTAEEGAFQLQLGMIVDGDVDLFDARATSTVAANAGHTTVDLAITV
ncbi:MAG: hypothetical protein AAFY28_08320 [Actinomycetota bacterium]